jgi:hypothetical protein
VKFEHIKKFRSRRDDPWAKPISPVSVAQMRRALRYKPDACILTNDDGNYLQVGRSGFCCCLEWHDTKGQRHCRAFQQPPVVPWPGVTRIYVIGGELCLRQEEYFSPTQATEALLAFLHHQPFPNYIQWRDITSELNAKGCTLFADTEAPRA